MKIALVVGAIVVVLGVVLVVALALSGGDDGEDASDNDESEEPEDDESDQGDDDGGDDGGDDDGGDDGGDEPSGGGFTSEDSTCGLATSGTSIDVGDVASSSIEGSEDVVTFRFTGDGGSVDVAVNETDGQLDPVVEVCDSSGNQIARDDDSGGFPNALIEDLDVGSGDEITIVVFGFLGESTGDFELSLS